MTNTLIIYSLLSFLFMLLSSKVSYKLKLLDIPNKRKIHLTPTAYTGGIIISIVYLFSMGLFIFENNKLNLIILTSFFIALIGLIDDKYNLNIKSKLILQIIPILYLIFFEKLILKDLGNYNYFIFDLGAFKIAFTLLSTLFLINAFNYFDGIDGSLGFNSISVFIIIFLLILDQNLKLFLIIILIPLFLFLLFNFSIFKLPKLFLGDGGSLLLGFIISFLLIYIANQNMVHPIVLAWTVSIFVYEFLSVNLVRLKNKINIFKARQDHLHHLILKKYNSIILTNIIMILINILFFIIGYFTYIYLSPLISLIMFVLCFIVFFVVRNNYLLNK